MRKYYIYKVCLVVEGDIEDLEIQNSVDKVINNSLDFLKENEIIVENVSVQLKDLCDNINHGKCIGCGTWSSDFRKKDAIKEFSNGAKLNQKWYCDLCLPDDHENHF